MMELENSDNPYPYKQIAIGEWRELATETIKENENIIINAETIIQMFSPKFGAR